MLPQRMIPRENMAMEGRANPKGIPYLYLSTDRVTAVAESRAGRKEAISVGIFEVNRDLWIVDCSISSTQSLNFYFKEPSPKKRTMAVWNDIDHAFSQPIKRSDDAAHYVPTQILAELFRHKGFDGILFSSSLANGRNLVLFDLKAAHLIQCCLYEITNINLEIQQAGNPYNVNRGKMTWNSIDLVGPAKVD
jgi:hypothetical protein